MKKILILAGAAVHCFLVETAKAMGLYTIVTDYLPPERAPAKQIADEYWMLDIMDVDGIVERCRAEGVDAVISACIDPAQRPYQEICERLGLPCYGTREQFFKLTNKKAFKALCRESGVDVIPDYMLEQCRDGTAEYPVLVKPADSRGSRGQTVCFTPAEVERAVALARRESGSGDFLIERHMQGKPMIVVSYWVSGGVPYLNRVMDSHHCNAEDGLAREGLVTISPSKYTQLYLERVDGRFKAMLCSLGIHDGPVTAQGFVDGDTVRFFDPGFREGGARGGKLFAAASGINLMRALVEIALGQDVSAYSAALEHVFDGRVFLHSGKKLMHIRYLVRPGIVARIEGIDRVRARAEVVETRQNRFPGDAIPASGDARQIAFYVDALVDDSPEKIQEMIEFVHDTLHYFDENGDVMGVPPHDLNAFCESYREG